MYEEKKWYYGVQSAEGTSCFVVELTESERQAVDKFLSNRKYVARQEYSGNCSLSNDGYSTLEEVIEYLRAEKEYLFWGDDCEDEYADEDEDENDQ